MRVRYPTDEPLVTIGCARDGKFANIIYMAPIEESDLDKISNDIDIILAMPFGNFIISSSNIYLAGQVDLTDDECIADIKHVRNRWCSEIHFGSSIPRNYDYKTNTGDLFEVVRDRKVSKMCAYVETFDNLKMFKFGHARLGYPKNIVVFKKQIIAR